MATTRASGCLRLSGFSDEISSDFDRQLEVVRSLDMDHISLRSADGRGVADYALADFEELLLPRLEAAGVSISSLGSPIGKIDIADEGAFAQQLAQLEELCRICERTGCEFIRMFSFYMPKDAPAADFRDEVMRKLRAFVAVAEAHGVTLIHENEKDIYGDVLERCEDIFASVDSPNFKAAFDFANFVQCDQDPVACWAALKDHVAYIHIKDAVYGNGENVVCGTGDGKIRQILDEAINTDGYEGFLTLEPHLVLFDALASLEQAEATDVIKHDKATDGAEGYAMQKRALVEVLERIGLERSGVGTYVRAAHV